jgi:anaerobic selenocysteine-containing dehydrogenase
MGPNSNLAEHLVEALNVVCGRMLRAGEKLDNPGVMAPPGVLKEGVIPAMRPWEHGYKSRIANTGLIAGELPCGIMADEILMPGPDRVRAFINHGGNPASAVPGQRRIVEAFRALDLLVSIEPFMTTTAHLSHYILPPTLQYERADLPLYAFERILFPTEPFMRYTPPAAKPPAGSEVVDDTYMFWSLAKRLGLELEYLGTRLDMTRPPTTDELLAIACNNGSVSLDELKMHPRGHVFDVEPAWVQPADEGWTSRFTLAPPDVVAEIEDLYAQDSGDAEQEFTHRLAVRRLRDVNNTTYRDMSGVRKRIPYNLAYINPLDLEERQVVPGDRITISSPHGSIVAEAEADPTLRRGVISIAHGFGKLPDEGSYDDDGSCTNLLLSLERNRQSINAMPEMTGIPLKFERLAGSAAPLISRWHGRASSPRAC